MALQDRRMTSFPTDYLVQREGIALAVREFGGTGPAMLYLPGSGRSSIDASLLAPSLTRNYRLLGMDLRGHGRSGDGPWSFEAVLDDVRAVIAQLGLERPVIIGHSLGGMIAAMLAETGECAAAINLDGHGSGTPDLYDRMSIEEVTRIRDQVTAMTKSRLGESKVIAPENAAELRSAMVSASKALGFNDSLAEQRIERAVTILEDGSAALRPSREVTMAILDEHVGLDLMDLYTRTTVPLLVYNAIGPMDVSPEAPDGLAEYVAAFRRGLTKALQSLAATHPLVSVEIVVATHDLHLEHPELIASQVTAWLERCGSTGALQSG